LCRVLEVSRSGFYAWRTRSESPHSKEDRRLTVHVRALFQEHKGRYGSPRIWRGLQGAHMHVSRKRVARLMRQEHLVARPKRRYCVTTDSKHTLPLAPNILERRFEADAPNRLWVSDITYLWTVEGWLYLAAVLDLFGRRVVGWAVEDHMREELTAKALAMAITRRQPSRGLIHHSDRGSQYAAAGYRSKLDEAGIACSMSRKGDCWDNAAMESFFSTMKTELVNELGRLGKAETRRVCIDYIESYYNTRRIHSTNGYLSPADFEEAWAGRGRRCELSSRAPTSACRHTEEEAVQ
jgi:transposase InsO family protein